MTTAPKSTDSEIPQNEHELDESSLSAIRSILTQDDAPAPKRRLPRAAAKPAETPAAIIPTRRKLDDLPLLEAAAEDPGAQAYAAAAMAPEPVKRRFSMRRKPADPNAPPTKYEALARDTMSNLRNYRPTPRHIILAGFALLLFMRPWLVVGVIFLLLFVTVGVFLVVGYDGFWKGIMKTARWYANRRPKRAAALHARLDDLATRWDAVLDRFPEGTVDGLYLPDFGEMALADRRHEEAMERRLTGLQQKGV